MISHCYSNWRKKVSGIQGLGVLSAEGFASCPFFQQLSHLPCNKGFHVLRQFDRLFVFRNRRIPFLPKGGFGFGGNPVFTQVISPSNDAVVKYTTVWY